MDANLPEVRAELEALIREAEELHAHPRGVYGPHPPLSEEQARAFEIAHGVALPPGYRDFLTQVGNGGWWPRMPLEPLGHIGVEPWLSGGDPRWSGSIPFPHTTAWNDPSGEPAYDEAREGNPEYEGQVRAWQEWYFRQELLCGAIPLHDHGCVRWSWLVVTGPSAGGVWFDCRVDRLGIYPITDHDGLWVRFLDWMLLRIDDARRWLRREQRQAEPLSWPTDLNENGTPGTA